MEKSLSKREDLTSTGLQFLFKNKIAPNPFIQMVYDLDAEFALVYVKDVVKGICSAASKKGLHYKNYLLTGESWKVSDISAMLNNKTSKGNARVVYKNDAAKHDLEMSFNAAKIPLEEFNT
ncbi:hypothetical protein [Formosa sp. PL04]|uniref:hypothetical protein n=1 Tax=Formosa sp. PL04 TaxID=3081755 RepID=UPI0029814358|nr:hypothetical protein [Formosa sp. PL04]MDW5291027.1 hypothetical protein [Formosa sp. PL04]